VFLALLSDLVWCGKMRICQTYQPESGIAMKTLFKRCIFGVTTSIALLAHAQDTRLHDAAIEGNVKLAAELIKAGALVTQTRKDGS
jgi:hypothetical protein